MGALEQRPIHPRHLAEPPAFQRECLGLVRPVQDRAGEGALRSVVGPKQREGIGMSAVQQRGYGLWRRLHFTPQISRAYSPIVRSDENQPTCAMFMIAALRHAVRFSHRASTSRWAAA